MPSLQSGQVPGLFFQFVGSQLYKASDELSEIFLRERKCTLLMVGITRVAELGWLDAP